MEEVVKYKALISDQLDVERLYMHNLPHILNRLAVLRVWLMDIKKLEEKTWDIKSQ